MSDGGGDGPGPGELLYAEDLNVGRRFQLGSHAVTAEEIKAFARDWDPLPFHVDERAAERSPFGGLIASGAHAMAICVRLVSDAVVSRTAVIAGRGVSEARFLVPMRPGMELTGTTTITDRRMDDERKALVVISNELNDQDGERIMVLVGELFVRRSGGL